MRIVCDNNMPYAAEAFGTLGEVVLREGRTITAADVRDAELLITRTTTKITRELLSGSHLRYYGAGVIGTDHIDISYLEEAGIPWSAAPGCNAESVSNYLTAALLWLGGRHGFRLEGKTLGVIGVGNVGRRVCVKARALGMRILACDPPRKRDAADVEAREFVALDDLLAASDVVTCHVPLTRAGMDRTFHMLDRAAFARMRPGVIFVNAARGEILDTDALLEALPTLGTSSGPVLPEPGLAPPRQGGATAPEHLGGVAHAVIDTWEGEPNYRPDLLARADIVSPHIAGHSFEGKVNGTMMVYAQACRVLGVKPTFQPQLPPPPVPEWHGDAAGRADEDVLRALVRTVYDIMGDDQRLRASCGTDAAARAKAFDRQRREYPMRREFAATVVRVSNASNGLLRKIRELGFRLNQ